MRRGKNGESGSLALVFKGYFHCSINFVLSYISSSISLVHYLHSWRLIFLNTSYLLVVCLRLWLRAPISFSVSSVCVACLGKGKSCDLHSSLLSGRGRAGCVTWLVRWMLVLTTPCQGHQPPAALSLSWWDLEANIPWLLPGFCRCGIYTPFMHCPGPLSVASLHSLRWTTCLFCSYFSQQSQMSLDYKFPF